MNPGTASILSVNFLRKESGMRIVRAERASNSF
jgi:hypothetical protein